MAHSPPLCSSFLFTLLLVLLLFTDPCVLLSKTQPHKLNWFLTSLTGKEAKVQSFTSTTSGHLIVGGTFTENLFLYPNARINNTEPSVSFENTSPYSLTRKSLFVIKLNEPDADILWQYSIDCETDNCKFYDMGVSKDNLTNPYVFLSVFLPLSKEIHPFVDPGGPLFFVLSLVDGTLKWNTQYLCYSKDCYLPHNVLVSRNRIFVSGIAKEDTYLSYGSFKVYTDSNANKVSNFFVQSFRINSTTWELKPRWTIQTHNTHEPTYPRIYHFANSNSTIYLSGYYTKDLSWIDRYQTNFTIVDTNNINSHSIFILKFNRTGVIQDLWTNTKLRLDLAVFLYSKQVGNDKFLTACMDNEGSRSFSCFTLLDDIKLEYYSSYNSSLQDNNGNCDTLQINSIAGISKDLYIAMRCVYTDKGSTIEKYIVNVRSITTFRESDTWQVSYTMEGNFSSMSLQRHEATDNVFVLINSDGSFSESVYDYTFVHENSAFTIFQLPFLYPHTYCFGIASNDTSVCSSHGVCIYENECECKPGWGSSNCEFPYCDRFLSNDTRVCSGFGECTYPNHCKCKELYTGDICQYPTCFNETSDHESVCSGRGRCTAPNKCECYEGYTGAQCELILCNMLDSNHLSVCSGFGKCVEYDTCECNTGHEGKWCQYPKCYNISSNSPQVCNGNGNCAGLNVCNCTEGHSGFQCEIHHCYGTPFNNTVVCSQHGSCIGKDNCKCELGYFGDTCELTECYGVLSNESSVCNGNGRCESLNTCRCSHEYIGKLCDNHIGWIIGISIGILILVVISGTTIGCVIYYYYSKRSKGKNQEKELQKKLIQISLSTSEHLEGQFSPFHLLRPSLGEYRELDEFSDPVTVTSSFNMSSSENTDPSAGIKAISESKMFIPFTDIEFEKKLGSGGGGDVFKALWKQNHVAVKKVDELESFLKEVTLLHNLKHPNIITIYGVSLLQDTFLIVMEYMSKGSLENLLYQLRIGSLGRVKLSDKISILLDISKGMDYLHTLKPPIIHRDLKPGNILMESSNKCKVADFGLSRALSNTNMTNNIGTLFYMGVELFEENGNISTALDVYSFAIICWELLFEENPYIYSEKNRKKLFKEIDYETSEYKKAGNNSFNVAGMVSRGTRPIIPFSSLKSCKEWCEEFLNYEHSNYEIVYSWTLLIKNCWDSNPDRRPTFSEITQKLMAFEDLLNK